MQGLEAETEKSLCVSKATPFENQLNIASWALGADGLLGSVVGGDCKLVKTLPVN